MDKRTAASIQKKINLAETRIAEERDKLRTLIDEAEALYGSCDDAMGALEDAADSLSQFV